VKEKIEMNIDKIFYFLHLFVVVFVSSLYEDQIGKFDW